MYTVIQLPPDRVVGSRSCCCHSFAACTVSALTSGLSRYSAQTKTPADCILPILVKKNWLSACFLPPRGSCHVKTARCVPAGCRDIPSEHLCMKKISTLSAWMSPSSFAGSPRCAFTLARNVATSALAVVLFQSSSVASNTMSASGAPTNVAFPL